MTSQLALKKWPLANQPQAFLKLRKKWWNQRSKRSVKPIPMDPWGSAVEGNAFRVTIWELKYLRGYFDPLKGNATRPQKKNPLKLPAFKRLDWCPTPVRRRPWRSWHPLFHHGIVPNLRTNLTVVHPSPFLLHKKLEYWISAVWYVLCQRIIKKSSIPFMMNHIFVFWIGLSLIILASSNESPW